MVKHMVGGTVFHEHDFYLYLDLYLVGDDTSISYTDPSCEPNIYWS